MATSNGALDFADYVDEVRGICEALPEVGEEAAWVGRRWKVRNQSFAHVLPIANGRPPVFAASAGSNGPITVMTFRATGIEFVALRQTGPPFFTLPWKNEFIGMILDEQTDWAEVAELITESYCLVAPKKLSSHINRPPD